ncbi:MAG: hypothetical protein WD883_00795 [Candidatus Colwellbacteria bacterium]
MVFYFGPPKPDWVDNVAHWVVVASYLSVILILLTILTTSWQLLGLVMIPITAMIVKIAYRHRPSVTVKWGQEYYAERRLKEAQAKREAPVVAASWASESAQPNQGIGSLGLVFALPAILTILLMVGIMWRLLS